MAPLATPTSAAYAYYTIGITNPFHRFFCIDYCYGGGVLNSVVKLDTLLIDYWMHKTFIHQNFIIEWCAKHPMF